MNLTKRATRGVTLMELMIVLLIIGILSAIAYPTYRNYVTQTRRSDAQIALTQAANLQEKFFTQCNYYAQTLAGARACGATSADGILGLATAGVVLSPQRHYVVTLVAPDAACPITSCYILQATPATKAQGGTALQAADGNFRLSSNGLKRWAKDGTTYTFDWTAK